MLLSYCDTKRTALGTALFEPLSGTNSLVFQNTLFINNTF